MLIFGTQSCNQITQHIIHQATVTGQGQDKPPSCQGREGLAAELKEKGGETVSNLKGKKSNQPVTYTEFN